MGVVATTGQRRCANPVDFVLSIAFSTVGGVLYGVLRTLNNKVIDGVLRIYLELFRAIPVLVWLYLLFFGLPIFLV